MKIKIDIDCTPQEARAFLGLPNIEPMQDALIAQMQQQLAKYLDASDPETLMKIWLPETIKGFGQLQEQFWQQFMGSMTSAAAGTKPGSGGKKD
jgi:hypothetical protein